ncbi:MAG: glycosyltransferase [Acidimicrobiales bacterium]
MNVGTPDIAMISPFPGIRAERANPSGVAGYTARLAQELASEGVGVHVVAPRIDGERDLDRVGGVTVERRFSRGGGALPKAVRVADETGAAVVHLQHEIFLFGGTSSIPGLVPALATLKRRRVGPVVTMHQVVDPSTIDREFTRVHRVQVPPKAAQLGLAALQRTVRRLAETVVVHDHSFRRLVPGAEVIHHGVDQSDIDSGADAKQALGLSPECLTVLCFGYLSPYKGLEAALDAAEQAGSAIELVVVGGEHPRLAGVDDYAAGLRRRYGSTARFVGYVPDDEVPGWFGAADLLLLPYPRPFSTSGPYARALGFGTPVLCSPELALSLGAPSDMVVSTEPVLLAGRLLELANDRKRLQPLQKLTGDLAKGRSWKQVAQRHVSIYEEVALANRTPGRSVRTRQFGG